MSNWYVFRIKPQRETDARQAIKRAYGIATCNIWTPWQAATKRTTRHAKRAKVVRKIIPGYLFVRSSCPLHAYMVSGAEPIIGQMKQNDKAVTIPDHVMTAMRHQIRQDARNKLYAIRKYRTPTKRRAVRFKLGDPEAGRLLQDLIEGREIIDPTSELEAA